MFPMNGFECTLPDLTALSDARVWQHQILGHLGRARTQRGYSALMCATDAALVGCTQVLIDAGADKNAKANVRFQSIVFCMLDRSVSVSQMLECLCFHEMCLCFSFVNDCVFRGLRFGILMYACVWWCLIACDHAQNGWTALINAAVHGRSYCVRLLLDAGADIFASDNVRVLSLAPLPCSGFLNFAFGAAMFGCIQAMTFFFSGHKDVVGSWGSLYLRCEQVVCCDFLVRNRYSKYVWVREMLGISNRLLSVLRFEIHASHTYYLRFCCLYTMVAFCGVCVDRRGKLRLPGRGRKVTDSLHGWFLRCVYH